MVAWSDDLLDDFRQDSGDTDFPSKVASSKIEEWYASVVDTAADDDQAYALVMVKIIRRLRADAAKKVDKRGEVELESRSQLFKHYGELLAEWEERAGLNSNGIITAGVFDLHIDYNQDDYDEEVGT